MGPSVRMSDHGLSSSMYREPPGKEVLGHDPHTLGDISIVTRTACSRFATPGRATSRMSTLSDFPSDVAQSLSGRWVISTPSARTCRRAWSCGRTRASSTITLSAAMVQQKERSQRRRGRHGRGVPRLEPSTRRPRSHGAGARYPARPLLSRDGRGPRPLVRVQRSRLTVVPFASTEAINTLSVAVWLGTPRTISRPASLPAGTEPST